MPEILVHQVANEQIAPLRPTPEAAALEDARTFIEREIPALQKLTGLQVDVQVGKGWATNTETGSFTVDPSFFLEHGYSPEHSVYATLHELMAHVRGVKRDPIGMARRNNFVGQGKAQHLFNNILTDIEGNKFMHRMLPALAKVAEDLYASKLFPLEKDGEPVDYASEPLHVQFLYKMIRQEMIPGSETPVRPEVDTALAGLRDYKGTGHDVIARLTKPDAKLPDSDRFDMQLATIYPVYKALLEQAKQEAEEQKQQQSSNQGSGQSGSSESSNQPGESDADTTPKNQSQDGQNSSSDSGEPSQSSRSDQQASKPQSSSSQDEPDSFSEVYEDYFDSKHPEPMSEVQEKALDDMIREAAREQQKAQQAPNPTNELDKQLRQETGFGIHKRDSYATEIEKHREAIDAMRDVYKSVIEERVAQRRGLSRQSYIEGDILNPNRLPQLIADKKAGIDEPEAFTRYEQVRGRTEMVGKTDYLFVFDRSSSMNENGKSQAAATSALILLEALAGMERDIKEAEEQTGLELDLDIRTALYTFDNTSDCLKQLSPGLSDRERLSVRQAILSPQGGTADFLALDDIATIPQESERKRIVIVISDGESNDTEHAAQAIQRLREQGVEVFGVGIGSDAATRLYAPLGRRVDNPADLPDVLQSFIESTLR